MSLEDIESERDDIVEEIRSLGEEQSEKRSNMPEQLQDADTGTILEERSGCCDEWADNLEGVEIPSEEDLTGEVTSDIDIEDSAQLDAAKSEDVSEAFSEKVDEIVEELKEFDYEGG